MKIPSKNIINNLEIVNRLKLTLTSICIKANKILENKSPNTRELLKYDNAIFLNNNSSVKGTIKTVLKKVKPSKKDSRL